jgi:hypothetical protein
VALAIVAPSLIVAAWRGELPHGSGASGAALGRIVPAGSTVNGLLGRWGQLDYERIAVSVPAALINPDFPTPTPRWLFKGWPRHQVESLFASAELPASLDGALRASRWEESAEGTALVPTPELISGLGPTARGKIYAALAPYEENGPQHFPEIYYSEYIDDRIKASGLSESSVALFKQLLYPRGAWSLFSDKNTALARIGDRGEKLRFLQTMYRRATYLVHLKVSRQTDLGALEEYWSYPGRPIGLRELLESLAREPEGGRLDLSHLLPPFARKRIYTFGDATADAPEKKHDCGWTAFNFFEETPDERVTDGDFARKLLETRYREVTAPGFGDLVVLVDGDDATIHLANYIAEDVVFTKNGVAATQPWIFMRMPHLLDLYAVGRAAGSQVRTRYFHRLDPAR